ncbi:MAG: hypothetical protein NVS3B20_10060 [Polyangiales bacterium]
MILRHPFLSIVATRPPTTQLRCPSAPPALRATRLAAYALAIACLPQLTACSAKKKDEGPGDLTGNGTSSDADTFDIGGGFDVNAEGNPPPCTGLQCQVKACGGSPNTSISGIVYAPNGTLPLYNVIVYVPNGELKPLTPGVTCDKCGTIASGDPIVTALSDYTGHFKLENVPVGTNIPVVFQLGKWRRKVIIPTVTACVDNFVPDANLTRLPKNQKEGDMPKIAVTTGSCDKLSCMLPKVGIDAEEFGPVGGKQAVTFYQGGGLTSGPGTTPAQSLWGNLAELKKYDLAIFSCECSESPTSKDSTAFQAVTNYLAQGGRIFTTDYQYTWYKMSPDTNLQNIGSIPGGAPPGKNPVNLDVSFPKGKALADWLKLVDPTTTYGKVTTDYTFDNFHSADKTKTTTWATSQSGGFGGGGGGGSGPEYPRFITVNTPVGKPTEMQCGKAVHLDAHINGSDSVDGSFPLGCKSKIKQGEEAFAFFFFDLASCIQKEGEPPKPPPPIK